MRAAALLPLLAVSLVAGVATAAGPVSAATNDTDTIAQIRGADGSIDFVPVKARTVADEVRIADAMPGSIGHAFDRPVAVDATATSDDPLRYLEWDLDAMHVDQVKPYLSPLTGQLVAIVDTGVDPAMPDWNPGQVRCDLGADLVLDGYTASSGGNGCIDPNGHGTHVAGTIGAAGDNGAGIEGVASGAQIMPVRVMSAQGTGTSATTSQGIVWAVDHGATVINLSVAGGYSSAYDTAVRYATDHGVSVVAAAGNNAATGNAQMWPCASPGAVCATATDEDNAIAPFSNYSGTATVAAPGMDILSFDVRRTNPSSPYVLMSGTSMASPHVAATVALYRAAHPDSTPAAVTAALTSTATDLGAAGWDPYFGAGLVDPYRLITGRSYSATPTTPTKPAVPAEPVHPAGKLTLSATTVKKGAKITVKGTNLKPGSVVTVRESFRSGKSTKTVTLGSGKAGASGVVTIVVKPAPAARTGTLVAAGVDRNAHAVKVSKSITVK